MGHLNLPFSASGFWLRPVFPIAFCHQKKFIDFFYLKANQLYLLVLIESRLFKVSLAEVLAAFNYLLLAAVPESAGLTVAPVVVLSAERLSVVLPEALVLLLQAVARHYELTQNTSDLDLISIYLNFIRFCQHTDGSFLNYVDEQKQFTNQNYETNLEDANGRAMWALGYLISLKAVLPPEWSETAGQRKYIRRGDGLYHQRLVLPECGAKPSVINKISQPPGYIVQAIGHRGMALV